MRTLHAHLALWAGIAFVALALTSASTPSVLVAGVVVLVSIAAIRVAVGVVGASEVAVGARARAHRQVLTGMPEPRHPATAGRPMARAPGELATA